MVGSQLRFAVAAVFFLQMAGCASTGNLNYAANEPVTAGGRIETPSHPLECVEFARAHSGIALRGDASEWWAQAAGRFARGDKPKEGSILVLTGYAGAHRSHLAVVREIISPREIRVDHSNWLNDGAVYLGDPVVDVSPENNWSEVRVYNQRASAWGRQTYLVQGFIGPGKLPDNMRLAEAN
jgi:hypothetical protein